MDTLFAEFQEAGSVAVGQFEQGQGKNLFDKGVNFIESGSLDTVGIDLVSTIRARTNGFIEVNQNTQYIGSVNNIYIVRAIYYYDVSFNFISLFVNDDASFTTPANTKYIRVLFRQITPLNDTIDSNDIEIISDTFQLELGNTATTYEPYTYLAIHNPASNDIPIPALNNKTLNEVFVGGNLFVDPDFLVDNNNDKLADTWNSLLDGSPRVYDLANNTQFFRVDVNTQNYARISSQINITTSNRLFYYGATVKTNDSTTKIRIRNLANTSQITNVFFNTSNYNSGLITFNTNVTNIRFEFLPYESVPLALPVISSIQYPLVLDMTTLGIASQTKAQMDAYFEAWQRNNAGTLLANTFIQHDQNSVPIADLNGKTLDEVFIGGQLLLNPKFDTDANYALINASIENGIGTFTTISGSAIDQNIATTTNGHNYYYTVTARRSNTTGQILPIFINSAGLIQSSQTVISVTNEYQRYSINISATSNLGTIFRLGRNFNVAGNSLINVDEHGLYNLTALGITATKEQLDFWYSVWQQNHKLGMRVHRASGNDIPLAVLNNQSLNQVFVGGNLDLSISHDIDDLYWKTNGNVSSLNNYFHSVGKNLHGNPFIMFSTVITSAATGAMATNNGFDTIYLPVKVGDIISTQNYQNSAGASLGYVIYDINNQRITSGSILENITMPSNAAYFARSLSKEKVSVAQIELGTTATTYEPFIEPTTSINLTSLGIATLTKSQLDYLFTVWQFNTLNALVARQFIQEA
jgi:hypothetical protein